MGVLFFNQITWFWRCISFWLPLFLFAHHTHHQQSSPPDDLEIFFFDFLFNNFTMMYLDMLSFNLSCIGFPGLFDMSFNCFQKFSAIIFQILLLPYFLFFFWDFNYIHLLLSLCLLSCSFLYIPSLWSPLASLWTFSSDHFTSSSSHYIASSSKPLHWILNLGYCIFKFRTTVQLFFKGSILFCLNSQLFSFFLKQ